MLCLFPAGWGCRLQNYTERGAALGRVGSGAGLGAVIGEIAGGSPIVAPRLVPLLARDRRLRWDRRWTRWTTATRNAFAKPSTHNKQAGYPAMRSLPWRMRDFTTTSSYVTSNPMAFGIPWMRRISSIYAGRE